jgi:hypothetical protein
MLVLVGRGFAQMNPHCFAAAAVGGEQQGREHSQKQRTRRKGEVEFARMEGEGGLSAASLAKFIRPVLERP